MRFLDLWSFLYEIFVPLGPYTTKLGNLLLGRAFFLPSSFCWQTQVSWVAARLCAVPDGQWGCSSTSKRRVATAARAAQSCTHPGMARPPVLPNVPGTRTGSRHSTHVAAAWLPRCAANVDTLCLRKKLEDATKNTILEPRFGVLICRTRGFVWSWGYPPSWCRQKRTSRHTTASMFQAVCTRQQAIPMSMWSDSWLCDWCKCSFFPFLPACFLASNFLVMGARWLFGLLSCLRRVCQGSTNVSSQRSVLCVQERVQNASCVFFPRNGPEKKHFFQNDIPSITAVKTWCDSETSWLIA